MKNLIKNLSEVFFKENLTCNFCRKEIFNGEYFCDDCKKELENLKGGAYCLTCGRRTTIPTVRCFSCKENWQVDMARSVFSYDGIIKNLISAFKYNENRYLANVFAPFLEKLYVSEKFDADAITFVPMSEERLFERGFNQSKELCEVLSKRLDIELIAPLFKKNEVKKQVGLTAKDRAMNIVSSFGYLDKKVIKDRKILLVDDVLTTGATSGEIAKMLKKQGATKVSLMTIASVKSLDI